MIRNTAREIAIHLSYELSFTGKTAGALLDQRLTSEAFADWAEEDFVYQEAPSPKQAAYIRRLVLGVDEHGAELDGYIDKYAKGWRRPSCGWRCMRFCICRTFPTAWQSTRR